MTIKWVKSDPLVMNGEPFCYGTRLTVRNLLEMRANGLRPADMMANHPELRRVGIAEAFRYASENHARYSDFFEATAFPTGDGATRLATGGTNLLASARAGLTGRVLAGIRAEACAVAPLDWRAGQGVEGVVKRRLFMGRRISLEIDADELGPLKVKPLTAQARWVREGERVFVVMPGEDILLFPMPAGGVAAALEVE